MNKNKTITSFDYYINHDAVDAYLWALSDFVNERYVRENRQGQPTVDHSAREEILNEYFDRIVQFKITIKNWKPIAPHLTKREIIWHIARLAGQHRSSMVRFFKKEGVKRFILRLKR